MTAPVRRRQASAKSKLWHIVKQGKKKALALASSSVGGLVSVVIFILVLVIVLMTTTTITNTSPSDKNMLFESSPRRPPPLRTVRLRSGLEMPAIGYGTCCRSTAKGEAVYESTKLYLKHGGRLIDTAMAYKNHKELGRAILDSNVPRHDIWITSKIAPNVVQSYDETIHAVNGILHELGTDYLDLILIHSPKLGKKKTCELWGGLIHVKEQGKARAIGVSNFNTLEIQDMADANDGVMPEVNQIQLHPWSPPQWKNAVDWGKQHGVTITAYTSLGGSRFHQHAAAAGDSRPVSPSSSPSWPGIVQQLAQRYSATPAQVLLQWSIRQGVAVIPGSGSEPHIIENLLLSQNNSTSSSSTSTNISTNSSMSSSLYDMTDQEAAAVEAAHPPRGWFDAKRGPFKMDGTAAEIAWERDI